MKSDKNNNKITNNTTEIIEVCFHKNRQRKKKYLIPIEI